MDTLGVTVADGDKCGSAVEGIMNAKVSGYTVRGTILESVKCADDLKVKGAPKRVTAKASVLDISHSNALAPHSVSTSEDHVPICGCSACNITYTAQGKGMQHLIEFLQCGTLMDTLGVTVADGDKCGSAVEGIMNAKVSGYNVRGTILESVKCAGDLKVKGAPKRVTAKASVLDISHSSDATSVIPAGADSDAPEEADDAPVEEDDAPEEDDDAPEEDDDAPVEEDDAQE
jgi:hypothetical protein